jgi:hypothetical protein
MLHHVVVSFGRGKEYLYEFSSADLAESSPEEARRWFDKEFTELKCEVVSPTGKVLIIDKIICIARNGGEQRFIDGKSWANQYARYTALALGRDTVRVDLETSTIGY